MSKRARSDDFETPDAKRQAVCGVEREVLEFERFLDEEIGEIGVLIFDEVRVSGDQVTAYMYGEYVRLPTTDLEDVRKWANEVDALNQKSLRKIDDFCQRFPAFSERPKIIETLNAIGMFGQALWTIRFKI